MSTSLVNSAFIIPNEQLTPHQRKYECLPIGRLDVSSAPDALHYLFLPIIYTTLFSSLRYSTRTRRQQIDMTD